MMDDNVKSFEFATGLGTENDPFIISDAETFLEMQNNLTGYYKLASDIDFENNTIMSIG